MRNMTGTTIGGSALQRRGGRMSRGIGRRHDYEAVDASTMAFAGDLTEAEFEQLLEMIRELTARVHRLEELAGLRVVPARPSAPLDVPVRRASEPKPIHQRPQASRHGPRSQDPGGSRSKRFRRLRALG